MTNRMINYSVFIAMGATLTGLGLIFMFAVNTVVGLSLLAVGLGNLAVGISGKRSKE